jgi:hypothetical protein
VNVSIIIPVPEVNDYVRETIATILCLPEQSWELLLVTNAKTESEWTDARIRVIPSGRVGPGEKRDLGSRVATGEILVFLDDDSFPNPDFLSKLGGAFTDGCAAVGGPAVTPPSDPFWAKVSGAVFMSRISGGSPERYLPMGSRRLVHDWPTVNFSILRESFLAVGGFDCRFWPGEDTFLCDKLTTHGIPITYDPEVIVWHHRRNSLRSHMRQVGGYGLHRGYFARRYGKSSRRFGYLLPSLLLIYTIGGLLASLLFPALLPLYLIGLAVYLTAQIIAAGQMIRSQGVRVAFGVIPYAVMTHYWYGARFILGFSRNRPLVSKLR